MKITCPSCSARYSIDDAKVKGKAFKFTCKKCGQTHVYRGTGDGAAAVAGGAAAAPAAGGAPAGGGYEEEAAWYVAVGEEQQGPYTVQQIREYAQSDQLDPESFLWKEGMEDWLPYQQIPEFADLSVGGDAGAGAPPPAESPADSPFAGLPDDVTVASPFAAAAPPADSGDLFSFGGGAGQRAAKAPEASPFDAFGAGGGGAAAVAARGGADVFGAAEQSPFDQTEDRDQDVMMGAAAAAPSPRVDASRMIGQRNENSVLFSLSSLQALAGGRGGGPSPAAASAGPSAAAAPKAGFATGEGSGLIDIRAMAGASAKREDKPDDLFSLGGGGAIGAPVAVPILTRPIRHDDESKKPMYILVGVIGAFAIAIVVLLVFLLKGGDKEKVVVKEVPVVAGADDGTVVAASAGGPEADAGAEEPDAGAGKAGEDQGASGDAGSDVPGDGDPNAKAADGADGGADGDEQPGTSGSSRRRDAGRTTGGDDPSGPGTDNPPPRDAGSSSQTRDAGRLAGDLTTLGITPRRDAGTSSSTSSPSSSGLSATPDRDTVRNKFESVRGAVRACTGGQAGTAQAQTTIQGSTGRVTRVNVTGDFTGPAATCITNAIRGLQFPQFSNPTLTVNYAYRF